MKTYHLLPLFLLFGTAGCTPKAVVKADVNATAKSTRESVVDLREKDKVEGIKRIKDSKSRFN